MVCFCSRGQIVFSSLHWNIASHCLVTLTEGQTSKCYQSGFQMTNWGLTPHEGSSFRFGRSKSIIWTLQSKCTIRMSLSANLLNQCTVWYLSVWPVMYLIYNTVLVQFFLDLQRILMSKIKSMVDISKNYSNYLIKWSTYLSMVSILQFSYNIHTILLS